MLTLHFSQNKKKQSLRTRLQEKWMSMSGGKPQLHPVYVITLAIVAVMQYAPPVISGLSAKDIPQIVLGPFFVFALNICIIALTGKIRGYIPESMYLGFKHQIFWMSIFFGMITLPVIVLAKEKGE